MPIKKERTAQTKLHSSEKPQGSSSATGNPSMAPTTFQPPEEGRDVGRRLGRRAPHSRGPALLPRQGSWGGGGWGLSTQVRTLAARTLAEAQNHLPSWAAVRLAASQGLLWGEGSKRAPDAAVTPGCCRSPVSATGLPPTPPPIWTGLVRSPPFPSTGSPLCYSTPQGSWAGRGGKQKGGEEKLWRRGRQLHPFSSGGFRRALPSPLTPPRQPHMLK